MKVRINNNTPNATQRKALRAECVKEFDKLLADYNGIEKSGCYCHSCGQALDWSDTE